MPRTRLVRINRTLYARVPAEEARRLGLREGQLVDVDVKPVTMSAREVLDKTRGRLKGAFVDEPPGSLWGA